jgi:phage baseplate assembly protein W
MAKAYSVKLPLSENLHDIGSYNSTLTDLIRQNIKMILLTVPGERIMYPEFGVGLRNYLFQPNDESLAGQIENRIEQQISQYAAGITIDLLEIQSNQDNYVVGVKLIVSFASENIFNLEIIVGS